MGMAASQARLLSITARMTDVEYKSQQISNTKVRLADESEQVANDYTKALNKQKLTYTDWTDGKMTKISLKPSNLAQLGYALKNEKGENVSPSVPNPKYDPSKPESDTNQKFIVNTNGKAVSATISESDLYEMIQSGQFYLESLTKVDENNKPVRVSVDGTNNLAIESDTTDLAKAEAEYNAKTAKINKKEKLLDNDLKALDTEHNALKTEYDSVKSLIKDNVDKTFNLFS